MPAGAIPVSPDWPAGLAMLPRPHMVAIIAARIEGGKVLGEPFVATPFNKPTRLPNNESSGGVGTRWPGAGNPGYYR
jgi:hypothetical protein